jgi:hypothetical protein
MNISLLTLALTVGQPVVPAVPPPTLPPAPVLFVKFKVPGTAKVTYYPGLDTATATNEAVALRPGYPFRLEVSDIPGHKNLKLYPSLEVRGTLVPRPGFEVWKHPVPLTLTERDIDRIVEGRLVMKYYYLENPDKAAAVSALPEEPLEFRADSEAEALKEARYRGRPMLVLRVGERPYTNEELKFENVPGTIIFSNTKTIPVPPIPPMYPFAGVIIYDPIIGARGASEECLKDGGDKKVPAGVGPDGKLRGLDPTDTVMQFVTPKGLAKVAPSNEVCICVPRFAAQVIDIGFGAHHTLKIPVAGHHLQPTSAMVAKTGTGVSIGAEQVSINVGATRPGGVQSLTSAGVIEHWITKPQGLYSLKGVAAHATLIGVEEITSFPNCNSLLLQKRV